MGQQPGKISASVMCANLVNLEKDLLELARGGVEYLHFDIMDGHFVPNITLGNDIMRAVRGRTGIPFDIHLMIESPESRLDWFDIRPGDLVSVHVESTRHAQRVVKRIRDLGARPAAALNPATPLCACDYLLDDVDMVLLMTVNPGYAGQALVESTIRKIADLRAYLAARGRGELPVEVDGNVSFDNAKRMRQAGADIFVAGSSSVFTKSMEMPDAIAALRRSIA